MFVKYNKHMEQMFGTHIRRFAMRSERVQEKRSNKGHKRTKHIFARFLLTICLITLFAIGGSAILTRARTAENQEKVYYKYYTQIEIQEGDSLWSLAGKYMVNGPYDSRKDYMEEVVELNQLSSVTIIKGQHLIVPYYEDTYK